MNIRKILFVVIHLLILLAMSVPVNAGLPIFYSWGGEKIIKVVDFPDTSEFQTQDGKYVDAGYIYKQVTVFFVPLWNYDERWCGYIGDSKHYLEISKTELDALAKLARVKLPEKYSLPEWDSYGGKLLLLGITIIFGMLYNKEAKSESESNTQSNTTI